jgi:hypothetical protein
MSQPSFKTEPTLKQQIDASRDRLQTLWETRGFTDPAVLAASVELDRLVNRYYRTNRARIAEDSKQFNPKTQFFES